MDNKVIVLFCIKEIGIKLSIISDAIHFFNNYDELDEYKKYISSHYKITLSKLSFSYTEIPVDEYNEIIKELKKFECYQSIEYKMIYKQEYLKTKIKKWIE